jgi:hypothetical protein
MDKAKEPQRPTQPTVTIEEVSRVLEVGRLLLSVLTTEELDELTELMNRYSSLPLTHADTWLSVEETLSQTRSAR